MAGRMTAEYEGATFTVDLQCTMTTADGVILIGGYTIDTTGGGSMLSPEGTLASIVLMRGSPVHATIWSERGGHVSQAPNCRAYLDGVLGELRAGNHRARPVTSTSRQAARCWSSAGCLPEDGVSAVLTSHVDVHNEGLAQPVIMAAHSD